MVLYPSFGLCAPSLEDPEFAAGFARLYNEWIADYCKPTGGRLRGIAVTPIEHGDGRDRHHARGEGARPGRDA